MSRARQPMDLEALSPDEVVDALAVEDILARPSDGFAEPGEGRRLNAAAPPLKQPQPPKAHGSHPQPRQAYGAACRHF